MHKIVETKAQDQDEKGGASETQGLPVWSSQALWAEGKGHHQRPGCRRGHAQCSDTGRLHDSLSHGSSQPRGPRAGSQGAAHAPPS